MKLNKGFYTFIRVVCIFLNISMPYVCMANRPTLKKKLLNWVEVFPHNYQQSHLPVQVIFDFHKEMDIQKIDKEVIDETSQLKLYLPDLTQEEFEKSQIKEKLSKISYIKSIAFEREKAAPSRSILTLTFVQENDVIRKKNSSAYGVIVKLSTMDNRRYNARRVILELYPRDILHNLCQNHRGLKQALLDDTQPFGKNDKYVTLTQVDMYKPLTNKRIIIDAGHGGSEAGGTGFFNLVEKNITLDIAQRIQPLLEQWGAKVVLTRSSDITVPLLKRSELAHQLKGDAFVSIHSNVAATEHSQGFETYSFDTNISKKAHTYFLKTTHDKELITEIDKCIEHHNNRAHQLAQAIHHNMAQTLPHAKSRGVKQEGYCLLLRSQIPTTDDFTHFIPTSLVEVGFTTSKSDAQKLASKHYRQLLAYAISNGIRDFFIHTPAQDNLIT